MNKINNNKFKNLVNCLKNTQNNKALISIQDNSSFVIDLNIFKYKKSLINFYNKININIIEKLDNKSNNLILENSLINKEKKYNSLIDDKKKNINASLVPKKNNLDVSSDKSYNQNNSKLYSNHYLQFLSENYNIIELSKSITDIYIKLLFSVISPFFRNALKNDKTLSFDSIKNYKLKIIDIFNKQNYYNLNNYSSKDFKKSYLDKTFIENLEISLNMVTVVADVMNVNLVYHHLDDGINNFKYKNNFIPSRATVLILENNSKLFSIVNKNSVHFIRGEELKSFLQFDKKMLLNQLEKLKLDKLQNIARKFNISIKKEGKNGKINKLKNELISELSTNYA